MCFSDHSLRHPPLPRSRGYYPNHQLTVSDGREDDLADHGDSARGIYVVGYFDSRTRYREGFQANMVDA